MGCWDIYCFLCGNTCHQSESAEVLLDNIKWYEENMKKKSNCFIKTFEPIYKTYIKNPKLFLQKNNDLIKNTKWLKDCTFLAADNTINHGCKETSCNIHFTDRKGNHYEHSSNYNVNSSKDSKFLKYGVFVHTDCWKFIKKEYNMKLSYEHLPIVDYKVTDNKIFKFISYGPMENYWDQQFNFIKMISDGNEELSSSPLKSDLVAKNIKKVFSKLKIRNDDNRKGPTVSATFYKNNIYKVGANGNIWTIKGNKWTEIKDTIKYKLTGNKLKKIILSADINTEPYFINKIKEFEIITTQEYINKKLN